MPGIEELSLPLSHERGNNGPEITGTVNDGLDMPAELTDISFVKGEARESGLVVPWSAWVPEVPIYAGRMVLAGGWTGTPEMYDEFCQKMAQRGIPIVNAETPHKKGFGAFSPLNLLKAWEHQADAINAVEADSRLLLGNGADPKSAYFAHSGSSEHALDASLASSVKPDYVMLFTGAGQDGDNCVGVLTRRLPWFMVKEGGPMLAKEVVKNPRKAGGYLVHVATHPLELIAEGVSAGNSEIIEKAKAAEEAGIKVVSIVTEDDEIFLADSVIAYVNGRIDIHRSKLKGHLALQTQPVEAADEITGLHNLIIPSGDDFAAAA